MLGDCLGKSISNSGNSNAKVLIKLSVSSALANTGGPQNVFISFKIRRKEKNFQIKGNDFMYNINIVIFTEMQC